MAGWKDKARARAKEAGEGDRFKLAVGANCFRFLPNKNREEAPYLELMMHENVGPDNRFARCGKDMDGRGKCWICDTKIPELKAAGGKKVMLAEALAPKSKLVFLVSPVDADSNKFGSPKVFTVNMAGAKSLGAILLSLLASPKRDYADPVKGYNVSISRTGTGKMDTRYGPPEPDTEPTKVPKDVLAAIKDFNNYIDAYSSEAQKKAYFGKADEPEDEEEEVEEVDEDAEETDEEEEESEEVDEDEDEEESEDEEEEDPEEEDEDEESEDEEVEEEEEEEEEEDPLPPPKKTTAKKTAAPPPAKPKFRKK